MAARSDHEFISFKWRIPTHPLGLFYRWPRCTSPAHHRPWTRFQGRVLCRNRFRTIHIGFHRNKFGWKSPNIYNSVDSNNTDYGGKSTMQRKLKKMSEMRRNCGKVCVCVMEKVIAVEYANKCVLCGNCYSNYYYQPMILRQIIVRHGWSEFYGARAYCVICIGYNWFKK